MKNARPRLLRRPPARAAVAALAMLAGAAAADRPSPLRFSVSPAGDGRTEFAWKVENAAVTHIELRPGNIPLLHCANDRSHLYGEGLWGEGAAF